MRKNLEAAAVVLLLMLQVFTGLALWGPHPLPERVPTHFDRAGNINGWGSPQYLLIFAMVPLFVYLLITVVSRFPATFNYPVAVTDENRERLQQITLDLLAWVKCEILLLFLYLQRTIIDVSRMGDAAHLDQSAVLVPLLSMVGVILLTNGLYMWRLYRAK